MSELVWDIPRSPDWKLTISLNCFMSFSHLRQSNPLNPALQNPLERVTGIEQR
jgi:hypothetical protein